MLVGADPASQVYVGAKGKAAKECGFHSLQFDLPETTAEANSSRWSIISTPTPRSMASSSNCRCPSDPFGPGAGGDRPQRMSTAFIRSTSALPRLANSAGADPLHACRRHDPDRSGLPSPGAQLDGATRSWSAAPTSWASRWRNCCCPAIARSRSPIRARAICLPSRPRRRAGRGRRSARDGARRLDQAGRDRHRRRRQPRRPAGPDASARRRHGSSATSPMPRPRTPGRSRRFPAASGR